MADIKRNIEIEANTGAAQDAIGKLADTMADLTKTAGEGSDAMKRATRSVHAATTASAAAAEAKRKEQRALTEATEAAKAHGKSSEQAAAATARLKVAQDEARKAHNEAAQAAEKAAKEVSELAATADKKAVAGLKRLADQLVKVGKEADANAADLRTLEHRIHSLGGEAEKSSGMLGMLKKGLAFGAGAAAAAGGVGLVVETIKGAGHFAVSTAATFERLKTALETTTGSATLANEKFAELQHFAAVTPYSLEEVTEGFIKLSNRGINANERLLTSLGNTASAMGKSLDDAVEAMADAITGENERLKEFGIVGKLAGDQVAYTFRGVTTMVKRDAASIAEYLTRLGETNFAGGMEKQSRTLSGMFSTLQDTAAQFADTLMSAGISDVLKDIMSEVTNLAGGGGELAKTMGGALASGLRTTWEILKDLAPVFMATAKAAKWLFDTVAWGLDAMHEQDAAFAAFGHSTELAHDRLKEYARAHGEALGPIGEMIKATFMEESAQRSLTAAIREGQRAREDQARTEGMVAALSARRAREESARLADLAARKASADKSAKMAEYAHLKDDKSLTPSQKKRLRELTKELDIEDTGAEDRAAKAAAKRAAAQHRKDEKSAKSMAAKDFDFDNDLEDFTRKSVLEAETRAYEEELELRQRKVDSIEREIDTINARGVAEAEQIDAIFYTIEVESEAALAREKLIEERIAAEERLARWELKNAKTAEQREKAQTRLEQAEHTKRLHGLQKAANAEAKEHAKRQKVVETVTGAVTTLGEGMVSAIEAAAEGEKAAVATMISELLKGVAKKHAILALGEAALAIGAAASYRYVAAAGHAAAAAMHGGVALAAGVGAYAAGQVAKAQTGPKYTVLNEDGSVDKRKTAEANGELPPTPADGYTPRSGGSTGGSGKSDEGLRAQEVPVSHKGLRRGDPSMNRGGEAQVIISGNHFYGTGGMEALTDAVARGMARANRSGYRAGR